MRVLIRLLKILLPLVILGVAGFAAYLLFITRPQVETLIPTVAAPGVRAQLVTLETVQISVASQGTVRPQTETQLVPEVAGRVTWVAPSFAEGGFFEAGDVLVSLDRFDYQQAAVSARSQLAQTRLRLAQERDLARAFNQRSFGHVLHTAGRSGSGKARITRSWSG